MQVRKVVFFRLVFGLFYASTRTAEGEKQHPWQLLSLRTPLRAAPGLLHQHPHQAPSACLLPRQSSQVPGSKSHQDAGDRLGPLIADTRQGPWCQPSHRRSERHPMATQPRQRIAATCGLAGRSRSVWCLLQGSAPQPGVPPQISWQREARALTRATLGACPHIRRMALLTSCYLESALKRLGDGQRCDALS